MTQCPEHPGRTGNDARDCRWCIQESVVTDHAAGVAAVKAALRNAPRPAIAAEPTTPTHDLAKARARADRMKENQP